MLVLLLTQGAPSRWNRLKM